MKVSISKKTFAILKALARESGETPRETLEKILKWEYEGRKKFKTTTCGGVAGRLDDLR